MATNTQDQSPADVPDTPLLTWSAPSMPTHERSERWYLIAGIVVLILAVGSILQGAWSFTLVLVLLSGVYFLVHREAPPQKLISIRIRNLVFDGQVIPWADCEGFWFLQGRDYLELHIERRNKQSPIVIQTGPVNPQELHTVLNQLIPELQNRRERLLDMFIRFSKL